MTKYVILEASKYSSVNWDDVLEEQGYERWNNSKTKFVLEFEGDTPEWLAGVNVYTASQIIEAMQNVGF